MKAYHFHNGRTLRDGTPLPPLGQKLVHNKPPVLCSSGLHFSRHPFDALQYAPGPFLDIVHVGGIVIEAEEKDKGVSTERTRIKTIDASPLLRKAARMWALSVIHLWEAPNIVKKYLETGDESLRAAARDAAWAATWAAARAAAQDATWAATWDAAWAATWAAARAAAQDAARDAARAATWAATKNKQRQQFLSLVEEAFNK